MLFLLLACTTPPDDTGAKQDSGGGGGSGAPDYMCDVAETAVAMDEVTPLGFSADDLALAFAGTYAATFTYNDGVTTGLSHTLALTDGATFIDQTYRQDTGGLDTGPQPGAPDTTGDPCVDYLTINADFTLLTDDSAFNEAWSGLVNAYDLNSLVFGGDIDINTLGGTWTPSDFDPADYDTASLSINGQIIIGDTISTSGTMQAQASRTNDTNTGSGASGSGIVGPVGAWSGPL